MNHPPMYSRPSASCCQNEWCSWSKQGCCSTMRVASCTECTLSSSIVALGKPWKHEFVFFFWRDSCFFESRKEGIREGGGSLRKQPTEIETYGNSTCFAMFPKHVSETLTENPNADLRTPPPQGGFLFTIFPHQEPCVRAAIEEDPPRRICTRFFEVVPLTHSSWWGNIVNRKPPQGRGFLSINLIAVWNICLYQNWVIYKNLNICHRWFHMVGATKFYVIFLGPNLKPSVTCIHILIYYSTFLQMNVSQVQSFSDQTRTKRWLKKNV